MAKKNIKKTTKELATETPAKHSGGAVKIDATVAEGAQGLKSPAPVVTAKLPPAPAAIPLQTLTPVTKSTAFQAPAQQVQKAPAKAAAPQTSPAPSAQAPKPAAQSEKIARKDRGGR